MAEVVAMPQLGNAVQSCLVTTWHIRVGDDVSPSTIVADIETDKSPMEVPAGVSGTVLALLAQEGDEVPVRAPFFIVGSPGEDISQLLAAGKPGADPPAQNNGPTDAAENGEPVAAAADQPAPEEKSDKTNSGEAAAADPVKKDGLPDGVKVSSAESDSTEKPASDAPAPTPAPPPASAAEQAAEASKDSSPATDAKERQASDTPASVPATPPASVVVKEPEVPQAPAPQADVKEESASDTSAAVPATLTESVGEQAPDGAQESSPETPTAPTPAADVTEESSSDVPAAVVPTAPAASADKAAEGLQDADKPEQTTDSPVRSAVGEDASASTQDSHQSRAGEEPEPVARRGVPAAGGGPASPRARRQAEEVGVDISTVVGTGPHGRILVSDVLAAVEAKAQPQHVSDEEVVQEHPEAAEAVKPAAEHPVASEPVAEKPDPDKPVTAEGAAAPAEDKPAADGSASDKPDAEKPAEAHPAPDEPVTTDASAEKTAMADQPTWLEPDVTQPASGVESSQKPPASGESDQEKPAAVEGAAESSQDKSAAAEGVAESAQDKPAATEDAAESAGEPPAPPELAEQSAAVEAGSEPAEEKPAMSAGADDPGQEQPVAESLPVESDEKPASAEAQPAAAVGADAGGHEAAAANTPQDSGTSETASTEEKARESAASESDVTQPTAAEPADVESGIPESGVPESGDADPGIPESGVAESGDGPSREAQTAAVPSGATESAVLAAGLVAAGVMGSDSEDNGRVANQDGVLGESDAEGNTEEGSARSQGGSGRWAWEESLTRDWDDSVTDDLDSAGPAFSRRTRGVSPLSASGIVVGTGIGGRVTRRDIWNAESAHAQALAAVAETGGTDGTGLPADDEEISESTRIVPSSADGFPGPYTETVLTGSRRLQAERRRASVASHAHMTFSASAPAASLLALRARFKASGETLGLSQVTIGDLVAYAAVRTVGRFPSINATVEGQTLRTYDAVHLGLAVDAPSGLVVPTIRFASQMGLKGFSLTTRALIAQARTDRIDPDLLAGATFTVTNLGAYGIESFTPILHSPQTAILGVNAIMARPVITPEGSLLAEQRISFSLTVDHAVVDGVEAARFLQALVAYVANIDVAILAEGGMSV